MSKINLTPNASGTGVFTIASPNSDTDRTLNLPDKAGTVNVGEGIDDNATSTAITIDSSGRVTMPYQPAFNAYITSSLSSDIAIKIFDLTTLNVGGHYNTTTGLFTAPVSGLYYFSSTFLDDAGTNEADYVLFLNGTSGTQIARMRTDGTGSNPHVTCNIDGLVIMEANDTVGLYQESGSGSIYGDSVSKWSTFKGFLVG